MSVGPNSTVSEPGKSRNDMGDGLSGLSVGRVGATKIMI